eukprot:SAG31_NODE_7925_length_1563_cov_1.014344_2_plen_93_part_00
MKMFHQRSYGTTDIILGGVDGTSSITSNDFNRRGEYEGGPDGCAIDFETSSSGVRVDGGLENAPYTRSSLDFQISCSMVCLVRWSLTILSNF